MADTHSKRILMVDDEPEFVAPYVELLKDEGYEVLQVSDVDTAVDLLKTQSFDLLALDMLMPPSKQFIDDLENLDLRETGVWLYRIIREELGLSSIPLVFITAVRDVRVREQITNGEAARGQQKVTFLTKPVSLVDLLNTIRSNFS